MKKHLFFQYIFHHFIDQWGQHRATLGALWVTLSLLWSLWVTLGSLWASDAYMCGLGGAEKRKVCSDLLDRIQDSMKSVIVSAPDYDALQIIHTARRLYQRRGLQGKEKQDMARRFSEGYKMLSYMVEGDPPEA